MYLFLHTSIFLGFRRCLKSFWWSKFQWRNIPSWKLKKTISFYLSLIGNNRKKSFLLTSAIYNIQIKDSLCLFRTLRISLTDIYFAWYKYSLSIFRFTACGYSKWQPHILWISKFSLFDFENIYSTWPSYS